MENLILEHRKRVVENIEKSFNGDLDIEKARSGVYADTAENRKLNRVGQHYGGSKQEQPAAGQPRAKKQEDEPKGGSEQKPDAGSNKDVERHYKSLLREKRGKRAKFLFDLKNDGASNSIDDFLDRNKKYFKDILDKYNVKDLYELEEKFEKEYKDDEDDPHGYEKYSKIYFKCANKIPLSAF